MVFQKEEKKMKKSIRILGMTLIMTIMAIIMAASVFAETTTYNVWPNTTDSYVTQSASSAYEVSGKVTVYLSLHSKKMSMELV